MLAQLFSRILAALPLAGITTFVTQYTNLLHASYLTHPAWSDTINENVRPIATVLMIVTFISLYDCSLQWLRGISITLMVLCLVLMGVCIWYFETFDQISGEQAVEQAKFQWKWFYVAACTCLVTGTTVASLWIIGPYSSTPNHQDERITNEPAPSTSGEAAS